jgi:ATP-dependent protease ClpP protease subunit
VKRQIDIFNYQIVSNSASNRAEIFIDGDIVDASTQEIYAEWWGDSTSVSYKSFRNELLNCGQTNVDVFVNSYGGHVGDAMAIHDLISELNNKGWNINTYGRGMVCSSATYIVMAGKNGGSVSSNTSWLIHNVSGGMYGNVVEMENYVAMMRKFNNMIIAFYVRVTGMTNEKVTELMNNETWFIGREIQDNGFVKDVTGEVAITNAIQPERWPFANKAVLNTYNKSIQNYNYMDIKQMIENLRKDMQALFANKDTKPEDLANSIATQISNVLEQANASNATAINDAVTTAVNAANTANAAAITEQITNAVNAATEANTAAFKNLLQEGTKGFVNEAKFNELIDGIAEKIGGLNNKGGNTGNGTPDPFAGVIVDVS